MSEASERHAPRRVGSDVPFYSGLVLLSGGYVLMVLGLIVGMLGYTSFDQFMAALASDYIRYAIRLSLVSCTITAILSLWVAVPTGYLFSRRDFPGKAVLDAILDIPIVLPPLVVGLGLLIVFTTPLGRAVDDLMDRVFGTTVSFAVPGVILAQFMVACAFAVRTMRATFDEIPPRCEAVALTLGCTRSQAFWQVVLPQARGGMVVAASIAWARALGEFGPILIFAGTTRGHTEVLSSSVFLELSVGNIEAAVAVSLLMVGAAVLLLALVRLCGYSLRPDLGTGR
ncbi:MAG: ABC transporter permease [bacterium]|nr:ABC transporter permease [bacterium]